MSVGVLKVGALTLNENYTIADATNAQSGVRTVNISGTETYPGRTLAQVQALADDLTSMYGRTVPVVFQHKTDRSGYYTIDDVNTTSVHWDGHATGFTWSLGLTRIGPDNAVDIESRLTTVNRVKVYAGTPEPWHAPPIGHHTYYVGASTPPTVVRQSVDGPITVYRNITVNPRYGLPVSSWDAGRVKFLDDNGILRTGQQIRLPAVNSWELNNGLIRVKPQPTSGTTTSILVAAWDGTAWRERPWDIRIAGDTIVPVTHWQAVTLLRNGPEMAVLRILSSQPSNGQRVLVDLVLRRGSRMVEGYVQRTVAGTISVQLDVADTFSAPANGFTQATGEDSFGLRWAAGSTGSFSAATNGGVSYSSNVSVDFWIGAEVPKPDIGSGTNYGFELGTTSGWSPLPGTTFAVDNTVAKYGSWSGKITAQGGTGQARVESTTAPGTAGKQYTISGWLRSPVALASALAELTIHWYNGTTWMSSNAIQTPALSAGVWTPISGTFTAPANTTAISRQFALNGTPLAGAVLNGDEIHVREVIDSGDRADTLALQYAASTRETMVVVQR